jgi:hypothetical protein
MTIKAKLTRAYDGGPLVVIESLGLGQGAELRPQRLRALAASLMRLADDAERRKLTHRGRPLPDETRTYGTAA